jgi:hypothetical protein
VSALVPALALGVLTASGCVWYVPALADLRAGADRPVSRRLAALACLGAWGATGLAALLLLTGMPWLLLVPGAGLLGSAALRLAAWVRARAEAREDAAYWAALDARPEVPGAPQRVVGAVLATGLSVAMAAALVLTWGHARGTVGARPLLAAPLVLTACTLAAALLTASRRGAGERTAARVPAVAGRSRTRSGARAAASGPGRAPHRAPSTGSRARGR